ncbi:MAG: hypothetical protein II923_02270 [Campylobacter sp.]|nr:hypothetical protein [Campylobacter sp.]MBQ6224237.1 hypothetical protein [Campylobacter sp.]MBQ7271739.1 hypothetical protein [Campylobacter sp.]MBR0071209.1 hypothetical protein [Campylobacter sp.]
MKRLILCVFVALLFGGCLAKQGARYDYYELKFSGDRCKNRVQNRKNIFIDRVMATNLVDRRDILIVDYKNKAWFVEDSKFITMPSEMVYKALIDGAFSTCELRPIFISNENELKLKTSLIALQVNGDQAVVTIGYEILNSLNKVKSGIVTKSVFVPDPSSESIFAGLNKSLNLAIDDILKAVR